MAQVTYRKNSIAVCKKENNSWICFLTSKTTEGTYDRFEVTMYPEKDNQWVENWASEIATEDEYLAKVQEVFDGMYKMV